MQAEEGEEGGQPFGARLAQPKPAHPHRSVNPLLGVKTLGVKHPVCVCTKYGTRVPWYRATAGNL